MALNDWQEEFYLDVCDIYNPSDIADGRLPNNDVRSLHYPATPDYTDQYYYRETAPEIERGKFFGRVNKEDTPSLMDRHHYDIAITIKPNAMVYHKTPNQPDSGEWFIVSGDSMVKDKFGNKQVVYVKRTNKPVDIS